MMEFEIWEDSDNSSEATTIQLDTGAPGSSTNENVLTPIDPETGLRQSVLEYHRREAAQRAYALRIAREARISTLASAVPLASTPVSAAPVASPPTEVTADPVSSSFENTMAQQANADPNAGYLQESNDDVSLADDLGEEEPLTLDPTQDPSLPSNLKEISSLASWQVSTSKPNCDVDALRSHSPAQYWQSDGPQPHLLTIHFYKWVKIVKLRVYLDFVLDESYTPTKMTFWGGTGLHDLIQFAEWQGQEPRGWVDISLDGAGPEGRAELRAFVIQVRVLENHQNGKDTHVRGVQLFAKDEEQGAVGFGWEKTSDGGGGRHGKGKGRDMDDEEEEGLEKKEPGWPSWMDDPVIR